MVGISIPDDFSHLKDGKKTAAHTRTRKAVTITKSNYIQVRFSQARVLSANIPVKLLILQSEGKILAGSSE